MDIAIGLPNAVPGTSGEQLTEWARRAEARGFSSLGTIDRIAYPNLEPLTSLAAAAAVTERIGLATTVLLGPLRVNPVALAKQVASLHAISGGRMTLGIGLGGREDDYGVAGVDMSTRGKDLDAMLERIKEVWEGDEMGPQTETQPRVLVGGSVEASFKRAARFGDGWIAAGASPEQFAEWREGHEAAWSQSGRSEAPQNAALAYFSLGDRAEENARDYLTDYYAWLGEEVAGYIADSAAKDAETVKQYVASFESANCQELFLFPSASDPQQVDLLADALGM
ncbi:MAG TPA: LLM class flavin-dependent oxidoreductase [Solirubrobacterales bacterium]|jgi:alkanesulfonate monooxygenase SsuD/methylene tetrahydromethanopterin reductase-like flavin-dependent oxidoreductase (luciferase family)|nr:LLM class flavin-dependent oxidoreductase [Solirubrobacterales bacterium]